MKIVSASESDLPVSPRHASKARQVHISVELWGMQLLCEAEPHSASHEPFPFAFGIVFDDITADLVHVTVYLHETGIFTMYSYWRELVNWNSLTQGLHVFWNWRAPNLIFPRGRSIIIPM